MLPLFICLLGISFFPTSFGFNWSYPVAAQQCSTFRIVVSGNVTAFPLTALIVPVGPSPLPHEVRKVLRIPFATNATAVSFQLPYPSGSKFIGLVTDVTSYRGSSSTRPVLPSDDASCFDATRDAVPSFNFSLSPTQISECRDVKIYWDSTKVQGTPWFIYAVPDNSFGPIPLGQLDTQPGLGTGFTWTPAIRAQSNLIIIGGDDRGMGSGGFLSIFVNPGDPSRDPTGACLGHTRATISASASASPSPLSASTSASGIDIGAMASGVFLYLLIFIF